MSQASPVGKSVGNWPAAEEGPLPSRVAGLCRPRSLNDVYGVGEEAGTGMNLKLGTIHTDGFGHAGNWKLPGLSLCRSVPQLRLPVVAPALARRIEG